MEGVAITHYWIGMNDMVNEGEWVWSDGSEVTWMNWREGWSKGGTDKNCATIFHGKWYAEECFNRYRFICKIPRG